MKKTSQVTITNDNFINLENSISKETNKNKNYNVEYNYILKKFETNNEINNNL